jgi:hypothetical protein
MPDIIKINSQAAKALRALHAEWRRFSPNLMGPEELDERGLRLWWTNGQLRSRKSRIESWNDLTASQARRLLKIMREETGWAAEYRAELIRRIACELAEPGDPTGEIRAHTRFGVSRLRSLAPADAHALIEELLSRLARKEIAMAGAEVRWDLVEARIEELRRRFRGGNSE